MRVPKRVKIVENNDTEENSEHYNQFIGSEHDVVIGDSFRVTLKIKSADGKYDDTHWYRGEYEVLEWEEIND